MIKRPDNRSFEILKSDAMIRGQLYSGNAFRLRCYFVTQCELEAVPHFDGNAGILLEVSPAAQKLGRRLRSIRRNTRVGTAAMFLAA